MKKSFLTIVAMLSMTMAYAETENVNIENNMKAYDMSVNYTKLAVCLGLDLDQMEVHLCAGTSTSGGSITISAATAT